MILTCAIVAIAIAVVAGALIRFWAFAVFALLVATGFVVMLLYQGGGLWRCLLWGIALLFVMEASYVLGVLLIGLWQKSRRQSHLDTVSEPDRTSEERRHH